MLDQVGQEVYGRAAGVRWRVGRGSASVDGGRLNVRHREAEGAGFCVLTHVGMGAC